MRNCWDRAGHSMNWQECCYYLSHRNWHGLSAGSANRIVSGKILPKHAIPQIPRGSNPIDDRRQTENFHLYGCWQKAGISHHNCMWHVPIGTSLPYGISGYKFRRGRKKLQRSAYGYSRWGSPVRRYRQFFQK